MGKRGWEEGILGLGCRADSYLYWSGDGLMNTVIAVLGSWRVYPTFQYPPASSAVHRGRRKTSRCQLGGSARPLVSRSSVLLPSSPAG